jgi:site-specific DNA-methyltransferase (adenine-specific)
MAKKPEHTRKLAADKIVLLPLAEIRPYDKNPRKNAEAVKYVKESIRQFGFKVPIVIDSNRVIVCGHTRLLAAKSLGMTEVPCIMADDLTDDQVKAFRLADNKVGEFADWDLGLLGDELDAIADASDIDMGDFGFDLSEMEEETEAEVTEDEVPEEVESVCKRGEIWQLGEHRLMCGDSTKAEDVARLMNGERADIAFTSPPYNAGSINQADNPSTHAKYGEYDDNKTSAEYLDFIKTNVGILLDNADEVFYNIGLVSGNNKEIFQLINIYLDKFKDMFYWRKSNCAPCIQPGVINNLVEFIIAFGNNGTRRFKNPQFSQGSYYNVIEGKNASDNEYSKIHKATFPVYLPAEFIKSFTPENGSVLDCFGGTGTTMIAAEQLGRKCYMMELDPHYCDIIIARWEKLTGEKAVKVED